MQHDGCNIFNGLCVKIMDALMFKCTPLVWEEVMHLMFVDHSLFPLAFRPVEEGITGGESGYQPPTKDIKDHLATGHKTSEFSARRRRGHEHLSTRIPLDLWKEKNLDHLKCRRGILKNTWKPHTPMIRAESHTSSYAIYPSTTTPAEWQPPRWSEVEGAVRKAWTASAPGSNRVP